MSEIKLAGLSAEGEEREYELSGFKGDRVVLYFIRKITPRAAHKKLVILEIMLTA